MMDRLQESRRFSKKGLELESAQFSISDYCSSKCVMCHQSKKFFEGHENHFLEPAVFRRFLREALENNLSFNSLYLFWMGEPLLHPQFSEFLEELANANEGGKIFRTWTISTNAVHLDKEKRQKIIGLCRSARYSTHEGYVKRERMLYNESSNSSSGNSMEGNGWAAPAFRPEYGEEPAVATGTMLFSIDAATEETYSRIRRQGSLSVVEKNIRDFVQEREELLGTESSKKLRVIFQFIVHELNEHEALLFAAKWRNFMSDFGKEITVLGSRSAFSQDAIYYRPLLLDEVYSSGEKRKIWEKLALKWKELVSYPAAETHRDDTFNSNSFNGYLFEEARDARLSFNDILCRGLFLAPVIGGDGTVTACCNDMFYDVSLGNLKKNTFLEIWLGRRARELRHAHIEGLIEKLPGICQRCHIARRKRTPEVRAVLEKTVAALPPELI